MNPKRAIVLILICVVLLCLQSHAWGPATHAYLVLKAFPGADPDMVFGAMHPDFNALVTGSPEAKSRLKHLTHYEFSRLKPSSFAQGFASHNGDWGADSFAHQYLRKEDRNAFPASTIHQISQELNISEHEAEDLFEGVMDVAVALSYGPELGRAIIAAANASGKENEDALVEAFCRPLCDSVPGLTPEQAESDIRWASRLHKVLLRACGIQLMQSRAHYSRFAPFFLSKALNCDTATASRYFEKTFGLCAGCLPDLDKVAGELAKRMKEHLGN